jgi:hypothetical protein
MFRFCAIQGNRQQARAAIAHVIHAVGSSPSLGTVELSAVSREEEEEALTKMRVELQYRIEWCLCSGASGDTVELQVQEERGRP